MKTAVCFCRCCGVPAYYHQREGCRLLFSNGLDNWTPADFAQHIYNAKYIKVDPDYVDARPRQTPEVVFSFMKKGGGPGGVSRRRLQRSMQIAVDESRQFIASRGIKVPGRRG
jgi:hypothetical protein